MFFELQYKFEVILNLIKCSFKIIFIYLKLFYFPKKKKIINSHYFNCMQFLLLWYLFYFHSPKINIIKIFILLNVNF